MTLNELNRVGVSVFGDPVNTTGFTKANFRGRCVNCVGLKSAMFSIVKIWSRVGNVP